VNTDLQELSVVKVILGVEFEDECIVDPVPCPYSQVDRKKQRLEKDQSDTSPQLPGISPGFVSKMCCYCPDLHDKLRALRQYRVLRVVHMHDRLD